MGVFRRMPKVFAGIAEGNSYLMIRDHIVRSPRQISAILVLIVIGVVGGYLLEGWTIVSSLYIIVQIITTIGYGDLTVTHQLTKIAMAIYAASLVMLAGFYLNLLTEAANQASATRFEAALSEARAGHEWTRTHAVDADADEGNRDSARSDARIPTPDRSHKAWWRNPKYAHIIWCTFWFVSSVAFGTIFYRIYERCSCSYGRSFVNGCSEVDFETCEKTGGYVKTWSDTFYMSVITLTTIGFGDHSPRSWTGRLIGCFWMLFGVASTANFVAAISKFFFGKEQDLDFDASIHLCVEQFADVDDDGSGAMSHAEFLSFMLSHHDLVSEDVLNQLSNLFDDLKENSEDDEVTLQALEKLHQVRAGEEMDSDCSDKLA